MATVEAVGGLASEWRGHDHPDTAAHVVATAWGLNTPARLAAALFVLPVLALIPARKPDVPVVAPHGDTTTAHVTR